MENFFFGIQALLVGMIDVLRGITRFQLFWGFTLGFLVSTLVHAFLIANSVKELPTMVFDDKAISFEKIHAREMNAPYIQSYTTYSKNVDKLKFVFYLAGFFLITLLMLITLSVK